MRSPVRLLLALSFMALLAGPAAAQTPTYVPAARYYGSATVLGRPAPANVAVYAQGAGGVPCGSGYVSASGGLYSVDIQPSSPCSGPINFFVNGQQTDQNSILPNFLSGAVPLNLTVSSGCGYLYAPYAVAASGCAAYGPPPPPVNASTYPPSALVTYQPGWNLIAGPSGDQSTGGSGSLFTFQPGDTAYETLPSSLPLQSGYGYWSLFLAATSVAVPAAGLTAVSRSIPAGQIALIGNPFARPATVSGASAVYTYDPVRGYQTTTLLQPGQGAWAVSGGGQVVISAT